MFSKIFAFVKVCREGLSSVISNRKNFGVKYFDRISLLYGQTLCKCFSEMLRNPETQSCMSKLKIISVALYLSYSTYFV